MAGPVANAAFLAAFPRFLDEYRSWLHYNDPHAPVPTDAQITANWRTTPFVQPVIATPNANPPPAPVPTLMSAALIVPPVPPTVQQVAFLNQRLAPRGIGKRPANWKGVEVLGLGGFAGASTSTAGAAFITQAPVSAMGAAAFAYAAM
ncbi:hypothetical protein IFR05_008014 [Cadophora sp. M221]|nr:hypothetical protein IFR05_008014 [Cadophora sp. M221]